MHTAGVIALVITAFGALCYATASILQAVAAQRSATTVQTMRHPLYLLGILCDALAWVGSIIALRELAVYLVESVLAGSLAVTVVAARFILGSRLRKRDVLAIVSVMGALTVLALSAGPQHDMATSTELRIGLCSAAAAAALLGWGAVKIGKPGLVAALGGLCLGGAALTGRALPSAALDVVTDPLIAALLVFAVTGMMMYAHALQIGQVGPVTAVHWTAEVVAPSAVALLLLGDTVRDGWHLPAGVAGLITVAAAVVLATAPATKATHQPEALPAAPTRPELGAAPTRTEPITVPLVPRRSAERVIWWGPPPIWIPQGRAAAAVPAAPVRELTWTPAPGQEFWTAPQPSDADHDEIPVAVPRPVPSRPVPATAAEPVRLSPWHDL